jgi:hypothetical protein
MHEAAAHFTRLFESRHMATAPGVRKTRVQSRIHESIQPHSRLGRFEKRFASRDGELARPRQLELLDLTPAHDCRCLSQTPGDVVGCMLLTWRVK